MRHVFKHQALSTCILATSDDSKEAACASRTQPLIVRAAINMLHMPLPSIMSLAELKLAANAVLLCIKYICNQFPWAQIASAYQTN